jgi:hypothetical protein
MTSIEPNDGGRLRESLAAAVRPGDDVGGSGTSISDSDPDADGTAETPRWIGSVRGFRLRSMSC